MITKKQNMRSARAARGQESYEFMSQDIDESFFKAIGLRELYNESPK